MTINVNPFDSAHSRNDVLDHHWLGVGTYNVQQFYPLESSAEFSSQDSPLKRECQKYKGPWKKRRCQQSIWNENRWLEKARILKEVISTGHKQFSLSLIGLQEIYDQRFLEKLADQSLDYYPKQKINSVVFVWMKNRFKYLRGNIFSSPDISRPLVGIVLQDRLTKEHWCALNVHLPSKRQTKKKRLLTLQFLNHKSKIFFQSCSNHRLILGDFNVLPEEFSKFCKKDESLFFCKKEFLTEKNIEALQQAPTFFSPRYRSRLDYIFNFTHQNIMTNVRIQKKSLFEYVISGRKNKRIKRITKKMDLTVRRDRDIGGTDHLLAITVFATRSF